MQCCRIFDVVPLCLMFACSPSASGKAGDFTAPEITRVGLPTERPVNPTDAIRLEFSEALATETVTADTVVVVPFEAGGACTVDLACTDGRCHQGQCQRDVVDAQWLSDLSRPPLGEPRHEQIAPVDLRLGPEGKVLTLQPRRPLAAGRLHVLLVSSAVLDRSGNPLATPDGELVSLRTVFYTSDVEQGRPTLTLVSPTRGTTDLPTNLSRLVLRSSAPLAGVDEGSLWLESDQGDVVELLPKRAGPSCGAPVRQCVRLEPQGPLSPLSTWTLQADADIRDEQGAPLLHADPPRIATGQAADHRAPEPLGLVVGVSDRCLIARLSTAEPSDVVMRLDTGTDAEAAAVGRLTHALALPVQLPLSATVALQVTDLAGNGAVPIVQRIEVRDVPRVVITEVLANPAGAEPDQEFVEIYNAGAGPVDLARWSISDQPGGEPSNVLPQVKLAPGRYAVIIGPRYSETSMDDVPLAKGTVIIRLERSVGSRGLANRGEALELRDASGELVSSYGAYLPTAKTADNGRSVERVDVTACDLERSWRHNVLGRATPGAPADVPVSP